MTSPEAPAFKANVVSLEASSIVPEIIISSLSAPPEVMVVVIAPPSNSTVSLVIATEPAEVKIVSEIVTSLAPEILIEPIAVSPTLPEKVTSPMLLPGAEAVPLFVLIIKLLSLPVSLMVVLNEMSSESAEAAVWMVILPEESRSTGPVKVIDPEVLALYVSPFKSMSAEVMAIFPESTCTFAKSTRLA